MATSDIDTKLLVDLAVDGSLTPREDEALRAHLAADETLQREERELGRLHRLLADGRLAARPGFAADVMAALPETAPWKQRRLLGWRSAVGVLAALLAVAVGLLGVGGTALQPASPLFGAARAVTDFAVAALLSGAGMLAASWRGVGLAVAAALDLPATVVFAIGVAAVNALLLVLLRRGARRRAESRATVRPRR